MHTKHNQLGFSTIEALLIILILSIIGGTGWFVIRAQKNTDKSLSDAGNSQVIQTIKKPSSSKATPTPVTNPSLSYYTTKNHAVSFNYPASWTIKDTSMSGDPEDMVQLTAPSGFTVSVSIENTGHPSSDVPPTVLLAQKLDLKLGEGAQMYLDYQAAIGVSNSQTVENAWLSMSATDPYDIYQFASYNLVINGASKMPESLTSAKADADYAAFVQIVNSVTIGA